MVVFIPPFFICYVAVCVGVRIVRFSVFQSFCGSFETSLDLIMVFAMVILIMSERVARLRANRRGQTTMNMATRTVGLIVALTVGGLVAAFLLPIAIGELVAIDTSAWGSGAQSLWDILDLAIVLGVFIGFIGVALGAAGRL